MFWTTWISFSTDSHRFIFSLIYLIPWHEPFTEEVSPWLKVPQVTFRMNSAFLCAHIWTFIIFTVAQRASCAWWTGGNKSAVVYCRWLHSTAASHSAALLSFCKCPLTLTPPLPSPHPTPFSMAQLIFPHYLHPFPPFLITFSSSRWWMFHFTVWTCWWRINKFSKNTVCGNNKPAD